MKSFQISSFMKSFQILNYDNKLNEAINELNLDFMSKLSSNIRIITGSQQKFLSEMKFTWNNLMSFELMEISTINSFKLLPSRANIFLINSSHDFALINMRNFERGGYFLIIVEDCSKIDSDEIFQAAWKQYIYNVNILCENQGMLIVKTFIPFQPTSCSNTSSVTIQNYSRKTIRNFFPEKVKNLFGCPIKLATFEYPPITMREKFDNGTFRYYGSEMDLAFGLADALNFSYEITFIMRSGASGLLLENGTATGLLKDTIEGDVEYLTGFYYLTYVRTKYMSFTQSHYSIPLIIMIPPGEQFSPFEKLFQPFEKIVWYCLLASFGISIIVIMIINRQGEKIKNFIFGEKIKTPYLNLIIHFVGSSHHVLPSTNFARSLLMMFMLFCLIQRSIYQGSLYLFLQSDGRKPEVTSVDEMIEKDFVFYIRETLEHNIRHMNFYNRRKVVQFNDYPELRLKTLDSSFKGGIIQPLLEVIYLNEQNYKNFTFNVLKEYLFDVQIVNYYPKDFYLAKALNDKIGTLKAAGLVTLWMDRYIDKSYIKINKQKTSARRLNIKQLFGGFQVLLIGVSLGFACFLLEISSPLKHFQFLRKIFL
ncbi:CLUMA_CG001444, isoform A [Clunio marinus]|uniref:CLUMA_CG001444, isoform A n=1 Tax=Clunio marinus TaxID=568069 RepID=A0A1J1HHY0_9DIPT|nr:CLUMA_CG001444, isoform A [Clunio marinus]